MTSRVAEDSRPRRSIDSIRSAARSRSSAAPCRCRSSRCVGPLTVITPRSSSACPRTPVATPERPSSSSSLVKAYRCSRTRTSSERSASAVVIVEGVNRTSVSRRKRSRRSSSGHVFLATMGSVAAHTARATFASNLLAAGGVAVDGGRQESPDDLVAAYAGLRQSSASRGATGRYDALGERGRRRPAPGRCLMGRGRPASRAAPWPHGRRLVRDGRRRAGVPGPDEGEAGMTVPESFAAQPWLSPEGIDILPAYGSSTSRGSTRSTPGRTPARSCAGPTRLCTRPSGGRSGSTPASPRPRSPTRSTAVTWRPARRAYERRVRPGDAPRLRLRPPPLLGDVGIGRRRHRLDLRHQDPVSTASRSTRCRCR